MKRLITSILLCLAAFATTAAQNKIDELTNSFSSTGSCRFTSAVQRNPGTQKVEKVVKQLTLNNNDTEAKKRRFDRAFDAEAKKADDYTINNTSPKRQTKVLTTSTAAYNCVYIMEYNGENNIPRLSITIIKTFK